MTFLYLLFISIFSLVVNASPSDHSLSFRTSRSIDKAVRKGSLWNPVVWYRGHHRHHPNLLDSLPSDIIKNHIADFLDLEDSLNFQRAFPDLGIGITPDQNALLSFLKKWNRNNQLLKSHKFNALYAKIDPSFLNDYLFRWAAATGWTELAEILSNDHRVNIYSNDNWAYILAKENDQSEILDLFQQLDPKISNLNPNRSSFRILLDILESNYDKAPQMLQSRSDLLLLLETSHQVRESSIIAICLAIQSGNQGYIKMLLDFFVFAKSYPWSSKIPKVDPFLDYPPAIFLLAIKEKNLEIANLILDKSLRFNPFTGFWSRRFRQRRRILVRALVQIRLSEAEMEEIWNRIDNILGCQMIWLYLKILTCTCLACFFIWI